MSIAYWCVLIAALLPYVWVGFAKGGADVALEAQPNGTTLLTYSVKADVGGKIAQLGARLIDSTAKSLAEKFFTTFGEKVGAQASA